MISHNTWSTLNYPHWQQRKTVLIIPKSFKCSSQTETTWFTTPLWTQREQARTLKEGAGDQGLWGHSLSYMTAPVCLRFSNKEQASFKVSYNQHRNVRRGELYNSEKENLLWRITFFTLKFLNLQNTGYNFSINTQKHFIRAKRNNQPLSACLHFVDICKIWLSQWGHWRFSELQSRTQC